MCTLTSGILLIWLQEFFFAFTDNNSLLSISVDSNGSEITSEDLFSDKECHSSHESSDEDISDDQTTCGEDRFVKIDALYIHLVYKGTCMLCCILR